MFRVLTSISLLVSGKCICHYGKWRECGESNPWNYTVPFGTKSFDCKRILKVFGVDKSEDSFSRKSRETKNTMASHVLPLGFDSSSVVLVNEKELARMGLSTTDLSNKEFVRALSGNALFQGIYII